MFEIFKLDIKNTIERCTLYAECNAHLDSYANACNSHVNAGSYRDYACCP